ncbi:MAG: PspC domain-containing protein [Candidatus Jorgensenbacteria bacterium]
MKNSTNTSNGAKKLHRSRTNKVCAGIIGGLGEYFGVDPALLRVVWIVILVFSGIVPGVIAYLLALLVVPKPVNHGNV